MRLAAALAATLVLVACGQPALSGDARDGEAARAASTAALIERDWPLAGSGPAIDLVRRVGSILARSAGTVPFRWRFSVVRDRSANAFAVGDGRIYVNEGAVLASRSEAELAAILAHEMGHQLAGHFGAASAERGASDRSIGGITQKLDLAKELDADRISLRILDGAGYDPHAALSIAARLAEPGSGGSAHFGDEQRIRALRSLLADVPRRGRTDSEEFRRVRRKMD